MCGLVMLVNKKKNGFSTTQQNVFASLLYLSGGFRGRDGAGAVVIDNIGNVKLAKAAVSVDHFLQTKEYAELDTAAFRTGWAMFGHNRAATRGVINDANSHPFIVDDKVVLVHNGTFNGDHKKIKDTEVDSEVIAHTLAEDISTEDALRKINAAYALIWYNVDKKQINVIRNHSRPLWYMETPDSYIYASEESFLQFVKHKYTLTCTRNPFEIKAESLSTFTLNDNKEFVVDCVDLDISYWKHNPTVTHEGGGSGTPSPFHQSYHGGRWHPYANGWLGMDDDDGYVFGAPTPSQKDIIIDTRNYDMRERIIKCIEKFITPVSNAAWCDMAEQYKSKSKVRVIVNDMVEADDYPKTRNYILIGKTLDANRLQVVFPMKDKSIEEIIEYAGEAVFEVETTAVTWQRVDSIPVDHGTDLKEWKGMALLHGTNAVPIYTSEGNKCAC